MSRTYGKKIILMAICLFLVLSDLMAAGAKEQSANRTVKAGIFYFEGYHMKDEEGNLTGYGIEFLNLVSTYSHLNFEYKGYDNSWGEMLTMLENGEIDMVTTARRTPEREEKFAFSLPMGRNNTVLSVRADNTKLHTGEYYTYDGMIVGVLTGSSQNQSLVEFAAEKKFSYKVKEFDNSDDLAQALQAGSIDAILSSNLRKTENEKTLDTITADNFYAVVRKEDTWLLDEINYAIEQMDINEGDWANVLYYRYYGPAYPSSLVLTEREKEYIQAVLSGEKTITAISNGDRKPYSYIEDGELKGILPDYFAYIMELVGLPYEMVIPDDQNDYYTLVNTNSVDVVIDRTRSDETTENSQYRGFNTDSYMTTGLARVTRKDFSGTVQRVAAADVQGDMSIEDGITADSEIINFSTREEALEAVKHGKADAAYMHTYTAQVFVNNDLTDSLQYSILNDTDFAFRMYVRDSCDHELATILDKCIRQIPKDVLSQLIIQYTSETVEDMTFARYMRAHPGIMLMWVLVFLAGTGVILALYLKAKWNRKILVATEKANREMGKQLAIVEALSRDYINVFAINGETGDARVIKMKGDIVAEMEDLKEEFSYDAVFDKYIENYIYPEDKEYLIEALSLPKVIEHLETDTKYTGSYRMSIDGEVHNFQFTYMKMEESDSSKEEFILAGFRNIDEMVRKEQEQKEVLSGALADAQRASHAKTIFLNNMSHDIRTPMNAIIGFTTLASSHIGNRELVQNYLSKIMTSSRHLLSLINDVLDMSRIESGKVKIEEQEASLPEILHDLKTIVQSDVKAKQLDFFVDTLDVTNETIICDKLRLNQVLLNILSNAMKYTKPGGKVMVRIVQTKDAPEGYASYQFHVKDTGIGMSKEFLKHVFEPFERESTATVSGIQGTGLGLAITKNIVDMMNGTITVESEEGKGSEFTVSFIFKVAGDPINIEHMKYLKDLRALIVDDDLNTCISVGKMLSSMGMRPDWTTLGKEAVFRTEFALGQKDPFSVYIIDWLMPDMNGVEIVRGIRRIAGNKVPVIMLTAYDWADIEEEAKKAGVTAFCSKPIFLSELCSLLAGTNSGQEDTEETEDEEKFLAGKKILLVEDNELNQEIAQTILEEAGLVIDTADDGTVAVEMMERASEDAYDLILMDIQMPIMDGYEATKAIRAMGNPVKSTIPIVAMTANAFDEDRQKAVDAGMSGYVPKPVDIVKLMETLKEFLGN